MQNWTELQEPLLGIREDLSNLHARAELMNQRRNALEGMVGLAKGRAALQPKLIEHLERLQALTHQKSVGVYEELLSAIVNDVLPGERRVLLDLTTERSLPALDIEIEKNGRREAISGGAVTNIVSAGLRVIALARSGHYPFMVLDEPDCWLKPSRVPQFANVLGQIASEIGIQALLISHHESSFFDQMASMVRLTRRGGKIEAERVGADPVWPEGAGGIRWIWLKNFMSHELTRIELGPGITCLTGENDIGKSAVAVALRGLFYGDSVDSSISHDKDAFEVGVEFCDGNRVVFEHFLKKSPKRKWSFYAPGMTEPTMSASPKHGPPDWLAEVAKVERSSGMDIALTDQKQPVFLLEETASKRAAILSVGRESGHLQRMIAKNRQKAADDGMMIREGEKEAASIGRQLSALTGLQELLARSKELARQFDVLKEAEAAESLSRQRFERYESLLRAVALCEPAMAASSAPKAPALAETRALGEALGRLRSLDRRCAVRLRWEAPSVPKLQSWEQGLKGASRLAWLTRVCGLRLESQAPLAPAAERWEAGLAKLAALRKARAVACLELSASAPRAPAMDAWEQGLKKARALAKAQRVSALLAPQSMPSVPALPSSQVMADSLLVMSSLEQKIAKLEALDQERRQREERLAEKTRRLSDAMGGVCPTCKQSVSVAHLVSGGGHA